MNSWTLHGGCKLCKNLWGKRERPFKLQRPPRLLRRKKGERDRWDVAFDAPKARPERGIDDSFDILGLRLGRQIGLVVLPLGGKMARKMWLYLQRHCSCRRVGRFSHSADLSVR